MAIVKWKNLSNGVEVSAGEFEFTLKNGFEPGRGYVHLGAKEFKELTPMGQVTLTARFAGARPPTSLTIRDLYLTDYTKKSDPSGNTIYTVSVADRRVRWKRFGQVTIYANYMLPDGTLDPASLKNGVPYTWKDLVLACIKAMGEEANLPTPDAIPTNPIAPRNVRWVGKNAARALEELLVVAGYTLAYHYNGEISVVSRGQAGYSTLPDASIYGGRRRTGKLFNLTPDAVEVIGAPMVNETSVLLAPCALDTDGEVKGLDSVSYLNGLDVEHELATEFASLHERPEEQALARASVGHYFRIPKTGKYEDEPHDANASLVPVLTAGLRGGKAPELEGVYFERGHKRAYSNVGSSNSPVKFAGGFSVTEPERGLLCTQKVCGTISDPEVKVLPSKSNAGPVKITIVGPRLTFRHYMRDESGAIRHWRWRSGAGSAVQTVYRPDMLLVHKERQPDASILRDLDCRAQEIASALTSVPASVNVETGSFAGAHPIKCDGVLERVSWKADHAGAQTLYSYGPPAGKLPDGEHVFFEMLRDPLAQAPPGAPLRGAGIINVNKRGPIVIRSSDARREALAGDDSLDDDEDCLFAELEEFDEEHQEPKLEKFGPAERHNWNYRDHAPSVNPKPDSQDKVWALQLISDDKFRPHGPLNRSTEVMRLCDENRGALEDSCRVRAIPAAEDVKFDLTQQRDSLTRVKIISTDETYRLMWLINTEIGGEGGWITDVPPEGRNLDAPSDEKEPSPPRRIGQIGNIVILTDDDEIVQTRDKDIFPYANIRHDAHFHKAAGADGRLYLTTTPPGILPDGIPYKGELVHDPALANIDTALGKESGEWRPQIPVPYGQGEWLLTKVTGYDMPAFAYIGDTAVMAATFAGPLL